MQIHGEIEFTITESSAKHVVAAAHRGLGQIVDPGEPNDIEGTSGAEWTTGIPSTPTGSPKTAPWCWWTIAA